jgi:hypothetical protein
VAPLASDARTAAYGSAYCIVLLILGWSFEVGVDIVVVDVVVVGAVEYTDTGGTDPPYPDGAGSENAPYASKLGREAG